MSAARAEIRDRISSEPGIHFNELRRSLDLATGQIQYHTRVLRQENKIVQEDIGGRSHFYLPTYGMWEREAIAMLRRETARGIIIYLLTHEKASPDAICKQLHIARSTFEWHVSNLVDFDIVEKQKRPSSDGVQRVEVRLTDPETTYRLLREIEPRVTDRLVDRFMRLTDKLFEQ